MGSLTWTSFVEYYIYSQSSILHKKDMIIFIYKKAILKKFKTNKNHLRNLTPFGLASVEIKTFPQNKSSQTPQCIIPNHGSCFDNLDQHPSYVILAIFVDIRRVTFPLDGRQRTKPRPPVSRHCLHISQW